MTTDPRGAASQPELAADRRTVRVLMPAGGVPFPPVTLSIISAARRSGCVVVIEPEGAR